MEEGGGVSGGEETAADIRLSPSANSLPLPSGRRSHSSSPDDQNPPCDSSPSPLCPHPPAAQQLHPQPCLTCSVSSSTELSPNSTGTCTLYARASSGVKSQFSGETP